MKSPININKEFFKHPLVKSISAILLIFVLATTFFLTGRLTGEKSGQNPTSICILSPACHAESGTGSIGDKATVTQAQPAPKLSLADATGAGAGVVSAAVGAAIFEAPLTVAVGAGLFVWWLFRSVLS